VFHSQSVLVDALLNCKEPTLIFTSKNPTRLQIDFTFGISNTFSLWIRRYRGREKNTCFNWRMFEALSKYFSTYVPTFKYNSCDQSYVLQEKKF